MRKLKTTEVAPVREALKKAQGNKCPLCERPFGTKRLAALDHDHATGFVRGALCMNCNGMEGKINNRVKRAAGLMDPLDWLKNLVAYLEHHNTPRHGGLVHPTHKTEAEKRDARNAKARARRAALRNKQ